MERSRTISDEITVLLQQKYGHKRLLNDESHDSIQELDEDSEKSEEEKNKEVENQLKDISVEENKIDSNSFEIKTNLKENTKELSEKIQELNENQNVHEILGGSDVKLEESVIIAPSSEMSQVFVINEVKLLDSPNDPDKSESCEIIDESNLYDESIKEIAEYKQGESIIQSFSPKNSNQKRAQTLNPTMLVPVSVREEEARENQIIKRKINKKTKTITPTLFLSGQRKSPNTIQNSSASITSRENSANSQMSNITINSNSMPIYEYQQSDGSRAGTGVGARSDLDGRLEQIQEEQLRTVSIEGIKMASTMSFHDMKGLVRREKRGTKADGGPVEEKKSSRWEKVKKFHILKSKNKRHRQRTEESIKLQEDISDILQTSRLSDEIIEDEFIINAEVNKNRRMSRNSRMSSSDYSFIVENINRETPSKLRGSPSNSKDVSRHFENDFSKMSEDEISMKLNNRLNRIYSDQSSKSRSNKDIPEHIKPNRSRYSRGYTSVMQTDQNRNEQQNLQKMLLGMPEIAENDSPDHSPLQAQSSKYQNAPNRARSGSMYDEYSKQSGSERQGTFEKYGVSTHTFEELHESRESRKRESISDSKNISEQFFEERQILNNIVAASEVMYLSSAKTDKNRGSAKSKARNSANNSAGNEVKQNENFGAGNLEKSRQALVEMNLTHQKLYFMYYLDLLGHPFSPKSSMTKYECSKYVQPVTILFLAKRLGIRITNVPFSSQESDLVWIAYLQAAAPMPSGFKKNIPISKICD